MFQMDKILEIKALKQTVVIKSNSHGIRLVLNPQLDFDTLRLEVKKKFQEAGQFFKDAKVGISFEGYELTREQMYTLIDDIETSADIRILCIMEDEKIQEACVIADAEAHIRNRVMDYSIIHEGSVHAGESLEAETGILVMGDIEQGATVAANGNIIVFGTLAGFAHAGQEGDQAAFIAALSIKTKRLQIGSIVFIPKKQDEGGKSGGFLRRKKKTKEIEQLSPQIARVRNGHVVMEPFTKDEA